jgi:hypothetical protein
MKKAILAILGLSFAFLVSSCEDKTKKKETKECGFKMEHPVPPVERERCHSKW